MIQAEFPGSYDQLVHICQFVRRAAVDAGFPPQAVDEIEMAVDEACSNIIEHAYGGEGRGSILCTCSVNGRAMEVRLEDRGKSFDPTSVPPPRVDVPLEEVRVGGLGLYFIRSLMDEVAFYFTPGSGNTLTMVKYKESPA